MFLMVILGLWGVVPSMSQKPGEGRHNPSRDRFGNNGITVQLSPLPFNGYGLEYSRNLYGQRHWLKVNGCVHLLNAPQRSRVSAINRMSGGSAGLYYQYNFFELKEAGFRTYFQTGLNYTYLDITNVAGSQRHIEKLGLDAVIGFRQNIAKPLFFDFYIGYGQRWLLSNLYDDTHVAATITDESVRKPLYSRHTLDYGRGGAVLVVGLNIGFCF